MTSGGNGRKLLVGGIVVAVALLALGVVLWRSEPDGYGWFAYGPPPPDDSSSSLVLMSGPRYAALGLFVGGLVLLGAVTGFALGRRSPHNAAG